MDDMGISTFNTEMKMKVRVGRNAPGLDGAWWRRLFKRRNVICTSGKSNVQYCIFAYLTLGFIKNLIDVT